MVHEEEEEEPRHRIIISILITAVHELAFIYDTRWSAPRHATHLTEAGGRAAAGNDAISRLRLYLARNVLVRRSATGAARRDRTHAREREIAPASVYRLSEVFQFVLLLHRVEWLKGLLRAATVALEMGFQTQRRRRRRRCWRYRVYKGVAEENSLYDD
uniref:Uncharacterized protein n=1 Tax=Trichogramma kaykai TaxID=54128 RepID=A0ABD2WR40_9HYME